MAAPATLRVAMRAGVLEYCAKSELHPRSGWGGLMQRPDRICRISYDLAATHSYLVVGLGPCLSVSGDGPLRLVASGSVESGAGACPFSAVTSLVVTCFGSEIER